MGTALPPTLHLLARQLALSSTEAALGLAPAPSSTATALLSAACSSSSRSCVQAPNKLVGIGLAAVALVTVSVTCLAVFALIKIMIRSVVIDPERPSSASELPAAADDSAGINSSKLVDAGAIGEARLVLFPGEERPHVVAVPAQLQIAIIVHDPAASSAEQERPDNGVKPIL